MATFSRSKAQFTSLSMPIGLIRFSRSIVCLPLLSPSLSYVVPRENLLRGTEFGSIFLFKISSLRFLSLVSLVSYANYRAPYTRPHAHTGDLRGTRGTLGTAQGNRRVALSPVAKIHGGQPGTKSRTDHWCGHDLGAKYGIDHRSSGPTSSSNSVSDQSIGVRIMSQNACLQASIPGM